MAALLSNSARVALRSGASASYKAGAAGLTFARGKATLPDLSCKINFPGAPALALLHRCTLQHE